MGVNGISGQNYSNQLYGTNNRIQNASERLASGNRINSAADDAAGLAIVEKLEQQIKGLDKGTENTLDMQNLLKTAEGGLNTVSDSLLRIHELSVQASNGIYTDSDKALLQEEVNSLLSHIDSVSKNTSFNNINLLDGSFQNRHLASSPDGSGMSLSIEGVSLSSLGMEGYDITKNIDIDKIASALDNVNSQRSSIGAAINRMDSMVAYNEQASLNMAESKMRIADTDMAKEVSNMNRDRVLQQYQIYVMKDAMANKGFALNLLG